MTVTDRMFTEADRLFGTRLRAVVGHQGDAFVVGYREGRDVCVIARAATWEEALRQATERVTLVDRFLETTSTDNATVATAAQVPVRFVRLRRRDLAVPRGRR
jgi:hypothetical protein